MWNSRQINCGNENMTACFEWLTLHGRKAKLTAACLKGPWTWKEKNIVVWKEGVHYDTSGMIKHLFLPGYIFFECTAKLIISDTFEFIFLCILWRPSVEGCQRCQSWTLSGLGWTCWGPNPAGIRTPNPQISSQMPWPLDRIKYDLGFVVWPWQYLQYYKKSS